MLNTDSPTLIEKKTFCTCFTYINMIEKKQNQTLT